MRRKKTKVVDVFAGGGGLSLGFGEAGFKVVAALDNWNPAIAFYKDNFDHPIIKCDLGDVSQSVSVIRKYEPDIIIGGPPCQDFSSAGKRNETLGRADLTLSFAEIISTIKPKFFVMENVARALTSQAFAKAKQIFVDAGFGLSIRVLDANLCGVPQIRKRLFVIGELNGEDDALIPFLNAGLGTKRITVSEHLGDKIDTQYYYRHPRSYYRRAIFSVDEPSPTIRGVNRPIPSGYPGHPGDRSEINEDVRSLTTRERALIQTFPDDIKLTGSKTELEQIIGNAVPVKLAEFVGKALLKYLAVKADKEKVTTNKVACVASK